MSAAIMDTTDNAATAATKTKTYYTVSDLEKENAIYVGRVADGSRIVILNFKNGVSAWLQKGRRPTFANRSDKMQVPGVLGANLNKHVRALFSL